MSVNFCPAGFEDSSDEDGFSFGDDAYETGYNAPKTSAKNDHVAPVTNRQGFGVPPAKQSKKVPQKLNNHRKHDAMNGSGQACFVNSRAGPLPKPVQKRNQEPNSTPRGDRDESKSSEQTSAKKTRSHWMESEAIPIDDFRMAVIRNNIEAVKDYLDQGVAVDTVFSTKWTALMYAAQDAQPNVVELLLERGADPNFSKDMYTVLMAACSSTCDREEDILRCVNLLLDKGVNVNAYDRYHMSALLYATRKLRTQVVKRLVEAQANLDKQDNKGYSALMCAAAQGHLRIIQVLLEAGADVGKQSCDGSRAVDIAALQGQKQAEDLISSKSDPTRTVDLTKLENSSEQLAPTVNGVSSLSMQGLQSQSSQDIYKYGDLELFLSGLELSHLIPLVQQHKVEFQDLLRMKDVELQQLGITQMGVRKKILDAIHDIHKKSWEKSSVTPVQYNNKITCADAVAMLTNLKQHVKYIGSSVGYVSDQITVNREILINAQDGASAEELSIQTEESITNIKFLFEELVSLRNHLTQVANRPDFKRPDLIVPRRKNKTSITSFKFLLTCAGICGLAYYKSDAISTSLKNLYQRFILRGT